MKLIAPTLDNLHKLYINQLQMLLSSEQQIIEALPSMIDRATDPQLKQTFQSHLQETNVHAERLEQILGEATGETNPIQSDVLTALTEEIEGMVADTPTDSIRDAALIAGAQRIEHYEIAVYRAQRHFAEILHENTAAELLSQTLKEEEHADHLLSKIAGRVDVYAEKEA